MRRNNLLRALTCSFVFTMLFSFEAQAKNFDNLFQLPDFSNKVVWVIRVGAGFNGVVGSNKETTKLQWNDGDWNGDFKKSIGYDISLGFNKSFAKRPLYWGMELGMTTRGYKTSASWEKGGTSAISGGSDYHGKFQDATMLCHTVRLSPFIVGYRYIFLEKMLEIAAWVFVWEFIHITVFKRTLKVIDRKKIKKILDAKIDFK